MLELSSILGATGACDGPWDVSWDTEGLAGVDVEAVGMAFSGGVGDSLGVCEGYVVNVLVGATVPVGTVFSATSNTLALSLSHPVEVAAAVNANLMAEVTSRVLFTMAASES